jgi:hypothetical protein
MKNLLKKIAMLSFAILMLGCSKDNDTSTPTEVAKTKVKITAIWVHTIPNLNGILNWDSSTNNPDIYIKCYDELGTLAASSTTLWNFVPTTSNPFTATFSTPISTTDLINTIVKVQVWDDDSDNLNPDDKIGEVPFYISDYTTGPNKYPSSAIKSDGVGTIVSLLLTWE